VRAYAELDAILDGMEAELPAGRMSGSAAIGCYLRQACAVAGRMPPQAADQQAGPGVAASRRAIVRRLDAFVARGRADGSVRAPVGGADVFLFGCLLTAPRAYERDPRRSAERQTAVFLNGLAGTGPTRPTDPGIDDDDPRGTPREDLAGGTSRFGVDCS
jgi:hypothetical protein